MKIIDGRKPCYFVEYVVLNNLPWEDDGEPKWAKRTLDYIVDDDYTTIGYAPSEVTQKMVIDTAKKLVKEECGEKPHKITRISYLYADHGKNAKPNFDTIYSITQCTD